MNLPILIAQGAEATQSSPTWIVGAIGAAGTGFTAVVGALLKEISKKFDALIHEVQENTKEQKSLGYRYKSLELALTAEALTRPNLPPFIRSEFEEKMKRRDEGRDTFGDQ